MVYRLSVARLIDPQLIDDPERNPFVQIPATWGRPRWALTRRAVAATRLHNTEPFRISENAAGFGGDYIWKPRDHLRRIRFFVDQTGPFDPVSINTDDEFNLLDGYHRLAAAIYRGDQWIPGTADDPEIPLDPELLKPFLYPLNPSMATATELVDAGWVIVEGR